MVPEIRIGMGYDVHRLSADRPLWLGGILIPAEKGCDGHSDADVLLHAICDALLGAASMRDIGFHFPNTSEEFKGADSKKLLTEVMRLIGEKSWGIVNIDATLALEQPKINPHIPEMIKAIAPILNVSEDRISIKATTNEKLGYAGREEGVNAWAVALLYRI